MSMRMFPMVAMLLVLSMPSFSSELTRTLKFVVVPEREFEKDEYTLFTVNSINEKISDMSIEYVESRVLEKLKKKMEKIYEEKKGETMSFAQLLASEAGGNVYVEVSTKVEEKRMEQLEKSFHSTPSVAVRQVYIRVTMSAYDVLTARGLGKTVVSTNVAIAGNTAEKIERVISVLSEIGLNDIITKIKKYLEGGRIISIKVIGVKNLSMEKDISSAIDAITSVKMKKRKSMAGGYVEYDVVVKGDIDEFVDNLRDTIEALEGVGKLDVTASQSLVIIKL